MNNNKSSGLGISEVLTLIFIVLKLCGVINWSWFWVLSPTLFAVILVLLISLILYIL